MKYMNERRPRRRTLALALALAVLAAATPPAPALIVQDAAKPSPAGCLLDSPDGKTVRILDENRRPLVQVGNLNLWCCGPIIAQPASAKETEPGVWTIGYDFSPKYNYRKPDIVTTVSARGGPLVEIISKFTIPDDGKKGEFEKAAGFSLIPGEKIVLGDAEHFVKTAVWRRDAKGGVPFEAKGAQLKTYSETNGPALAYLWFHDPGWLYMHGNKEGRHRLTYDSDVVGGKTNHASRMLFVRASGAAGRTFAEAAANGLPVAVGFTSPNAFHVFDSSREKAVCGVTLTNTRGEKTAGEMQIDIYDWDGRQTDRYRDRVELEPLGIRSFTCTFPKEADAMWFVEVRFVADKPFPDPLWKPTAKAGEPEKPVELREVFARTQVAAMSPYAFRHPETSIMGMAATFFSIPGMDEVLSFEKRIGVRWQRFGGSKEDIGDNRVLTPRYGMKSLYSQGPASQITNQAERVEYVKKHLRRALERECPYFEFGNEINFGNNAAAEVDFYEPWCDALRDALAEVPCKGRMRITTFGYAGADPDNLNELYRRGCMACFDDVCLHPGRLNQTPDSSGPFWAWHYRPAIQAMKRCIKSNGGGQGLIMTEVYARTPPNKGDSDSMRMAAENLLLSCVIAKAEDVSALFWYQMHDSVHNDIGGADPTDTEHHYGIVMRDGAAKPSALAYRTAARILDGAEFVKEAEFVGRPLKAWCFTTPDGPMAVLVDRADGVIAYPDMSRGHKDPWLSHWKTKTEYEFPCAGKSVTVLDCIGRRTDVKVKDGKVKLVLDGSPVAVYGLNL